MKLYNSESRTVEELVPHNKDVVTLYTCGPTVYHYAHIGNLRTYIMEDVLEKSLKYLGYNVLRAMNITDVGHLTSDGDTGEDKMLKGAEREHKTVMEIAQFFTDAFKQDCQKLNIAWPEIVVPATSCIDDYIKIISSLMEKGFAYKSGENVYFDTSKLKNYFRFGNHNTDDLVVGARDDVEEDQQKRNKNDFVLWFTKSKFENHALKWNSPWGVGYPGWHIECSGISNKYLGEYLDIHCGGVDNRFPHHTNEIAQTESYVGHKWCGHWFHVEHLNDASGKMSKSKGEFLTVSLLEKKGFDPLCYRFYCLQSHYRRQLVYSDENLLGAKSAFDKLLKRLSSLKADQSEINQKDFDEFDGKFKDALSNDLNTSLAITTLFDVLKADISINTKIALVKSFDKVLGLDLEKSIGQEKEQSTQINDDLEKHVLEKIEERKLAKQQKDYAKADLIRAELAQLGVELIDTKDGTTYKLK